MPLDTDLNVLDTNRQLTGEKSILTQNSKQVLKHLTTLTPNKSEKLSSRQGSSKNFSFKL